MITGEFILVLLITLLNILLWVAFFVKLKRTLSPQRILIDIKNEVEKLLIEINKTVADDITLIDDRSNKVKEIIDECEKKIALYYAQENSKGREIDVLQRLSNTKTVLPKVQSIINKYQTKAVASDHFVDDDSVQLSIDFETNRINEQSLLFEENNSVTSTVPTIMEVEDSKIQEVPFKKKVLQLASNYLSAEQIAQKLGCTETEVQIILDLYF